MITREFGDSSTPWHRWRGTPDRPTTAAPGSAAARSSRVGRVADRCRPGPRAAVPVVRSAFVATPGPLGPVTVIGDSVLVGATLRAVAADVARRSAVGGRSQYPRRRRVSRRGTSNRPASEAAAANWITWWRQAGWDAAQRGRQPRQQRRRLLRYRRGLQRQHDPVSARRGSGPATRCGGARSRGIPALAAEQTAYNQALDLVAAERRDAAHLGLADRRRGQRDRDRARRRAPARHRPTTGADPTLMADDITAQLAVATRVGGDAPVPVAAGAPSEYVPLDRRSAARHPAAARGTPRGGRRADDRRSAGLVPAGSTGGGRQPHERRPRARQGFLTGRRLRLSGRTHRAANYAPGGARGAFAVVPLSMPTDVVRLLVGGVGSDRRPAGGVRWAGCTVEEATRFTPRAPERLVDTRASGRASMVVMAAPAGATRCGDEPHRHRRRGPGLPHGVPVRRDGAGRVERELPGGRDDRRVGVRARRGRRTRVRVLERAGRRDRRPHRHVRAPAARWPSRRPRRPGCSTPATRSADGRRCRESARRSTCGRRPTRRSR